MEPAQAVRDSADIVVALSLSSLDETVAEHGASFRVQPAPDVGQAERPVSDPLVELLVNGLRLFNDPALDLDGLLEVAPPVMHLAEVPEATEINVRGTQRFTEADGCLGHPDAPLRPPCTPN